MSQSVKRAHMSINRERELSDRLSVYPTKSESQADYENSQVKFPVKRKVSDFLCPYVTRWEITTPVIPVKIPFSRKIYSHLFHGLTI